MATLTCRKWIERLVLAAACAAPAIGCGDDDGGGAAGGCTTDVECKGDRVCVDRECVDPDDAPIRSRDGGTSSGGAGRGSSAGRGGSAGSEDTDAGPRAGSGGRMMVIDDPELEAACSLNCEARHAAQCEMNIGSLDQCLGQCLIADEINYSYCLEEQTAQYACLASGGYTCVSGYPQQRATCIAESQALSLCSQMAPCRMFCEQAAGECAPEGEACVEECDATRNGFEDAICGVYYTQLLSCWAQGLTCEGDRPAVGSCGPQVSEVADCVGRRTHECEGFCWAAEALGCGSDDCVTTCREAADATQCGSYYRNLIDCAIGSHALQLSCEDGVPTPDATQCSSYIMQYDTCIAGM